MINPVKYIYKKAGHDQRASQTPNRWWADGCPTLFAGWEVM